jgi:hypothetical protein
VGAPPRAGFFPPVQGNSALLDDHDPAPHPAAELVVVTVVADARRGPP